MALDTLPVLSLADDKAAFSQAIGESFRTFGFALVKDFAIDPKLIARAWQLSEEFFALPEAEKRGYHDPAIGGARGYTPFGIEIAKDAKHHDLKEFWHVGRDLPAGSPLADASMPPNVWPARPADFQEVFSELYHQFDSTGATILSAIILREAVGVHRWGAVALGFIGVLIVVQPQAGHLPILGAATGLTSALLTAFVTILLRQLGSTEPALTTVFWFFTMSSIPLACAMPWFAQSHPPIVWALLIGMGIVGGLGQVALTLSLQYAPVSTVAPVDYASLIWSTLFGVWLFAEVPTAWTWVGAPIIIGSGLYIVWRERVRQRTTTLVATAD